LKLDLSRQKKHWRRGMFLERGWLGFPRRRDLAQCDTEVVLGALEIAASAATLWWARIARRKSDLGHNRLRASQSSRRGKYPGARPSQSLSVATLIGRPYRVTKLLNPFEFIAGFQCHQDAFEPRRCRPVRFLQRSANFSDAS
jgi:hypothetical protein